ncbi:MAG TPA: oligosaccharide flippase family protein [Mycobacteriales bacterium]|nr:oligosaccharide flippase family protein [Mycobacteriales bacterium]
MTTTDVTAVDAVEVAASEPLSDVSRKVGRSAAVLVVRRIVVTAASALSTVILARRLSISDFGAYSAGLATYYLLLSACDLGFNAVLVRELAIRPSGHASWLRITTQLALIWSLVIGGALLVIGLAAGPGGLRGQTMLALSPALALTGMTVTRQVFMATYDVRRIAMIDMVANIAQSAGLCLVALAGFPTALLAVWIAVTTIADTLVIARMAVREVPRSPGDRANHRLILRMALPLGLTSILASAYFMVDISIDGFLVRPAALAGYAAAVKVLTILLSLPGLVMGVALPGLSRQTSDPSTLSELTARVWHWFATTLLPLTIGMLVFAPIVMGVIFGPAYAHAVGLLRILLASGVIALLSNVVGNVLVAQRRAAVMLVQNSVALGLNVIGNVLLVPRVGVIASAWLTLGTEALVCGASLAWLMGRLRFRPLAAATVRPALALVPIAAAGWLLGTGSWLAVAVGTVAFLLVLSLLGAWPADAPLPRRLTADAA